ncbi:MAG: hypothetical protein ACKO2G_13420 [Verrucomicrobiales bacterium]
MLRILLTLVSATTMLAAADATPASFKAATPVWPETGSDDLNRRVGFRIALDSIPEDAVLRLATSGLSRAKTVTFVVPAHPLEECRCSFPTADGDIVVEWKRCGNSKLTLPKGWRQVAPMKKTAP